jgi:DNA-binding transcriptional MerR regulator/mannose-6-phosphate isomerase-like protein (cupin superfamily)
LLAEANGSSRFRIGEVSQEIGVTPGTLRLWESEGLIEPGRTGGGRRLYTEADVERLKLIRRLRVVERLNLAAIRKQLGPAVSDRHEGEDDGRRVGHGWTLGERLRRLRQNAGKTLKDVGDASGLSASFISSLERGETGASVVSIRALAEVFGVTARELFGADLRSSSPVVRAGERPIIQWENGIRFEELSASGTAMSPSLVRVPANTGSGGFYYHAGEEYMHVVSGVLFVELKDRETYRLEPGDTIYFSSTVYHRWWAGEEAVEAFFVNTPPSF